MLYYKKQTYEEDMATKIKLNQKIKNLLIIGDSYSTFKGYVPEGYALYYTGDGQCGVTSVEETWWKRFVNETGTNLVLNDSWSGSTVCYTGRQSPEYGYRSSFVNRMHLMLKDDFFNQKEIKTSVNLEADNTVKGAVAHKARQPRILQTDIH